MQAVAKLNPREITLYRTEAANTFCQGPVAEKCKLRDKLRQEERRMESRERRANDGPDAEDEQVRGLEKIMLK